MGAEQPTCPECTTAVREDWDWCHNCGFDPDGLKPADWFPGDNRSNTLTLAAPAPTRRRKAKRAAQAEAELARKQQAAALTLPPLTRRPPAAPPAAAIRPDPVAEPAPGPSPLPTRRVAPAPTEQVFAAPKVPMVTGLGLVLFLLAAFLAFWAVSAVVSLFDGGSVLHVASNVFFVLVCLGLAGAMVVQGRALLTMRVIVTPTELVAHGRSVRVQRAQLDEIYSFRMGRRPMSALLGEPETVEVPYVQRQDGSGFWLDALGGLSAERPPTPGQLAMYDQISVLIQRSRSVGPA